RAVGVYGAIGERARGAVGAGCAMVFLHGPPRTREPQPLPWVTPRVAGRSDALLLIIERSPMGRQNHRMLPFGFEIKQLWSGTLWQKRGQGAETRGSLFGPAGAFKQKGTLSSVCCSSNLFFD